MNDASKTCISNQSSVWAVDTYNITYSLIEMFQEKECKKVFSHYSFLECPNEIETTARNEQIITVSWAQGDLVVKSCM